MHQELSEETKKQYPLPEFERLYDDADTTATISSVHTDTVESAKTPTVGGGRFDVVVHTNAFGSLRGRMVRAPRRQLGRLGPDARLPRPAPRRAPRAPHAPPDPGADPGHNGTPLATGPAAARTSPLGPSAGRRHGHRLRAEGEAGDGAGDARSSRPATRPARAASSWPSTRASPGHPGGQLLAVGRGTAARPRLHERRSRGEPVKTTIDPDLQDAAVAGARPRLRRRRRARRPERRRARRSPARPSRPPAARLDLQDRSPPRPRSRRESSSSTTNSKSPTASTSAAASSTTPTASTAAAPSARPSPSPATPSSPRSAPKIGNDELVETAEQLRLQLAADPLRAAALAPSRTRRDRRSRTKSANEIDLGVSARSARARCWRRRCEMASVAQTIANGGVREPTSIVTNKNAAADAEPVRVMSKKIAGELTELMIGVVTAAPAPPARSPRPRSPARPAPPSSGPSLGRRRPTRRQPSRTSTPGSPPSPPPPKPKLAVAAMVFNANGDGGTVAAPIVRSVLESGLSG